MCLFSIFPHKLVSFYTDLWSWLVSFLSSLSPWHVSFPLPVPLTYGLCLFTPILDDILKKKTHAIAHVKKFYYLCSRF